jgi:hypothetical protein
MTVMNVKKAGHRFDVGDSVFLKRGIPQYNAPAGQFEILGQLPARDGEMQYRIKSDREICQRVAGEDQLDLRTPQ